MKFLIILVNLVLACGVGVQLFSMLKPKTELAVTTKDRSRRHTSGTTQRTAKAEPLPTFSEALELTASSNPFNTARCPEYLAGRGGNSQLLLLGVYNTGACKGAIFQQNQRAARFFPGMGNRSQSVIPPKRFLKVGDSLENGYTLLEVHADHVVLGRSGGTLEMYIQRPSHNMPSSVASRNAAMRRSSPSQQQIQTGMMAQQLNLMRQLVNGQQNAGRNSNSNRSTRSRR